MAPEMPPLAAILPFAEAVEAVFGGLLGFAVRRTEIAPPGVGAGREFLGIVGFAGRCQGVLALRLPEAFAAACAGRLPGGLDPNAAMQEITGAVARHARERVARSMLEFQTGLPVSAGGPAGLLAHPKELSAAAVGYETEDGARFWMELSIGPP